MLICSTFKEQRFKISKDPDYLFSAAADIEKKQLQRNINLSFRRGKKLYFVGT